MAKPVSDCNGLCMMASDLIAGMSPNQVAYAHDECPLHGIGYMDDFDVDVEEPDGQAE